MIKKFFLFLLLLMSFFSIASAFLISDQGTSVRNLSGSLLDSGNLTIAVYDDITAGNLIFSSTTSGAIVNGSWNLMINPAIEYGVRYWKDYEINGEDVDFDGNERIEFQSSVGYINNISFVNLSLINSCPSGSSIRLIYSNGSVECETDDLGNGTSSDLTNYALKNQSETFSGNITTVHTGLFGFLGSLANRITKLFAVDLDVSNNVDVTGNVSASYFEGDGSLLTNLPAGSESDPIFVSENSTLWGAINSKLSQVDQRYNDTALIVSVNRTTNIMSLGFYNRTEIDSLISGVSAGNSSFNQSLTDILYYSILNPAGFVNSSGLSVYNETSLILTTNSSLWDYIISNQAIWSSTYNVTYAGLINNASYLSTYNGTYANIINQQCPVGLVVNGTLGNGTFTCITPPAGSESDPLWVSNLTSGVSSDLNPLTNVIQSLGNSAKRWLKGWFKDLDVSNNISVGGNVSAQFYFGSLNSSTFPTSSCSGTDKVVSVLANGTVNCGSDLTGAGSGVSFTTFNMTTSDVSTTDNVNYVDVLTLPLVSGRDIMIECILLQDSAATGTGVHYDSVLTGTSSQRQVMEYYSSVTAQAICQGTTATLTCLPTSSSGTTVTPNRLYVYAITSSTGTFTLNVKSETSNAVSVKAGSWCRSIET
ncbi:hypothetical protein J4423_02820 [Candidatus Pacearchaeota archaeon]|nr:hypothetical protein [Candidatus Pacearchaeota archaeon]